MQQKQYYLESLESEILAIAPIQNLDDILILTQLGILYRFSLIKQSLTKISHIQLPPLNKSNDAYRPPHYDLYVSDNGLFSAIVINYGQNGMVIDHTSGQIILNLNCGDYYSELVPFSVAFTVLNQDDIIIYRTDWNRLDSFNLTQKNSSTDRLIQPDKDQQPEHYLDYFHGKLYVSPTGEFILDDGWVWQIMAITHIWSLHHWLKQNPFESENGQSLQSIAFEEEGWNYPMCWLDHRSFAMWQTLISQQEHDGTQGVESVFCPHIRINTILAQHILHSEIWKFPQQTQEVFNLYVNADILIIVGSENISLYHIQSRDLIKQFPNTLPQKHYLKRRSLCTFKSKTVIETHY